MGSIVAVVQAEASAVIIPGPITLAQRAQRGEFWCVCHGWHRHDGLLPLSCPAERSA